MRTDAKVALVAVLIIVVLVIIYFAFRNPSSRTAENNALPSAQPALVESTNLPGSSPVPPALTQPSQTQPGLISLPATTATSMPATMPSLAGQTATSMPALATGQTTAASPTAAPASPTGATADNSNATLSLDTPAADTGNSGLNTTNSSNAGNSVNSGSAANGNTNATLNFPPVNSGSSGSASSVALGSRRHRHRSRTLTLSAPHGNIYIVRKNDTLASISRRIYGSERMIHALERANPGLDPRRMRIGQRIRLPHHGRTAMTGTSHRVRHHTYASSSRGGRTYVVRAGEDLSGIARRFYGNPGLWRRIYNANRRIIGSSPNKLRAGERIVIPPK